MGATRVDLRLAAAMGELEVNPVMFEACQSVNYGGVLFLLPFLLAQGLFYLPGLLPQAGGRVLQFRHGDPDCFVHVPVQDKNH